MKGILIIFFCSFSIVACSQQLNEADKQSRQKADKVVESQLKEEIEGRNHIIFSVADKDFIVLVENTGSYKEYYIRSIDNGEVKILKDTTLSLSGELAKKMFDKTIYRDDFVTFDSDFFKPEYEASSGNITYFVLKDKQGKRYGEARLSVFIKPNPIDSSVYSYFVERLLYYTKSI